MGKLEDTIKYKWEDEKYLYKTDKFGELINECIKNGTMSTPSLLVMNIIECNITMNDNVCKLSAKEIAEKTGIHPKKVYKYINELINVNIINKSLYNDKYAYYVNPEYIKHSRYISKNTLKLFNLEYNDIAKCNDKSAKMGF